MFGGVEMPIFLLTLFAKNEKDNPCKAGQAELVAAKRPAPAPVTDRLSFAPLLSENPTLLSSITSPR